MPRSHGLFGTDGGVPAPEPALGMALLGLPDLAAGGVAIDGALEAARFEHCLWPSAADMLRRDCSNAGCCCESKHIGVDIFRRCLPTEPTDRGGGPMDVSAIAPN